jgi:hypothetical protein
MATGSAIFHAFRPFGNVAFSPQNTTRIVRVIPFAVLFGHDPEMQIQIPAFLLVTKDELVNRLMADIQFFLFPKDVGNLFRAKILFQETYHHTHLCFGKSGSAMNAPPSSHGIAMGGFSPILVVAGLAISL